jgi:hypothetical protein
MNALTEINEILQREKVFLVGAVICWGNPPRHADPCQKSVLYVGHSTEEKQAFDQFVARRYDPGYGGQELYGTLWFSDHRWAIRGEYDGSEWWEIHEFPTPPRRPNVEEA